MAVGGYTANRAIPHAARGTTSVGGGTRGNYRGTPLAGVGLGQIITVPILLGIMYVKA